jgi:hypothetical protein
MGKCIRFNFSMRAAIVSAIVLFCAPEAIAGLTVSLKVNGAPIALLPMYWDSGTPDTNSPYDDGFVAVAGLRIDIDKNDPGQQLFIDALWLTSEKSSSEGKVTTINISTRFSGTRDANVVLTAFDDFALPATTDNTPLLITSAFQYAQWSSSDSIRPISLTSYLDNQSIAPLVATGAGLPDPISEVKNTIGPAPFQLRSEFSFRIAPNSSVAFMAESIATSVREGPGPEIAVVPELGSAAAWGCMLALLGTIYLARRRVLRVPS